MFVLGATLDNQPETYVPLAWLDKNEFGEWTLIPGMLPGFARLQIKVENGMNFASLNLSKEEKFNLLKEGNGEQAFEAHQKGMIKAYKRLISEQNQEDK